MSSMKGRAKNCSESWHSCDNCYQCITLHLTFECDVPIATSASENHRVNMSSSDHSVSRATKEATITNKSE